MKPVVVSVLSLIVMWSVTFAQPEVTGRVESALGKAPQTWFTLASGNGLQSAEWSEIMEGRFAFSIHAHPDVQYVLPGSIVIDFSFFSRSEACPCVAEYPVMRYYPTDRADGSMFESEDPEITITAIEWRDDASVRVIGSFRATLSFRPDFRSEPEPWDTVALAGTFDVLVAAADFDDD